MRWTNELVDSVVELLWNQTVKENEVDGPSFEVG